MKEGLTSLKQLERFPEILVTTQEEPRVSATTWEEAQLPCCNSRRNMTSPPQLERSPDSLVATWKLSTDHNRNSRGTPCFPSQVKRTPSSPSTRDKAWFPCSNSDGTPRSPWQLERNTVFPTSTWDEAWFPGSDSKGIPSSPRQLESRPYSSEATREVPWDPCHNSNTKIPVATWVESRVSHLNTRGVRINPAAIREESLVPPCYSKGYFTPFWQVKMFQENPLQLKRNPEFPAAMGEEPHVPLPHLEMRPKCPALTQEVSLVPHHNSKQTLRLPPQLERNPDPPQSIRGLTPLLHLEK